MSQSNVMKLTCEKAILQDPQNIAAEGKYPAKTQIKISAGRSTFFLSSATTDLTQLPELEPVVIEADVLRFGGGKGFFVVEVGMVTVKPYVAPAGKASK